jgi:hypothetical protein
MLRRFDPAQQSRFSYASSVRLQPVLGNRTPCQLDRLQKFRCVRTVGKPNFVLTRRTCEAAASRRTLRVLQDLRRTAGYGIARVAVPVMLISGTRFGRSGGFAAARYRVVSRFKQSTRLKFSREAKGVHVAAQLPSQADKNRRALARRRSRLGGSELHARVTSAAVRSCHSPVSRGSRRAASGGRRGRRLLQLRVSTLCGCTNLAVQLLPNSLRDLLIVAAMSRADVEHQSRGTRRMLHWQSVRTFSAFGTRSKGVGSITWPAQWNKNSAQAQRSARKDGYRSSLVHLPPSRRRRGAAPAAPSPNQTICSKHRRRGSYRNRAPECREQSEWHECVWRR